MYTTIKDFTETFTRESGNTMQVLDEMTDEALSESVSEVHRSLGRLAWHIVVTYPEMMQYADLGFNSVQDGDPLPGTLAEIKQGYTSVCEELMSHINDRVDDSMFEEHKFYDSMWTLGYSLEVLIHHEIHHRAQMIVLLRQAGLKVPEIYGPNLEGWAAFGAKPPVV